MRAPTNRSVDRRVFRNTASRTKDVNLAQRIYRGGIRF